MPQAKTIILIGAGHVNLYVAAHARALIEHGGRVVLIDPGVFWYSGMATGLQAQRLVFEPDLPSRSEEGLLINRNLHSLGDPRVFSGGDCAAMEGISLPKLGVFGVRQAACVHANLLAALKGEPLIGYIPQKNYLAILNLGDNTALATWSKLWWNGRISMKIKECIDQRFLQGYRR